MIYVFTTEDEAGYMHLVSSLIREEVGKTLADIRTNKQLTVYDISELYNYNPAMPYALE